MSIACPNFNTLPRSHWRKLFDLIITHTGLGQDIEHNQAIAELLPLLEYMDRGAGIEPERARETGWLL